MTATERRLLALERRAAVATSAHYGVMTPEQWGALQRGDTVWPAGLSGGVFVISGALPPDEWERAARKQQAKLTGQYEHD